MTPSARPIAPKTLTLLVAGVLLAHGLLLQVGARLSSNGQMVQRAFTTRMIEIKSTPTKPAESGPTRPSKPRPAALSKPSGPSLTISDGSETAPEPEPLSNPEPTPSPISEATTQVFAPEPSPEPDRTGISPAEPDNVTQNETAPSIATQTYLIPGSIRLKYDITGEVKKLNYSAGAELLWLHDGQTYDARLEISAFLLGSRVQTSRGRITAQGLEPNRFGDKVRSEVAAHFQRDKGKITFSANTPDVPLLAGAQDRLSVFFQLAALFAGDPLKFPPKSSLSLFTASAREADNWLFQVEDFEKLELPGGEQLAIKLIRQPRHPYDQTVEIWLAPNLSYLPVRIRLSQSNGDFVDQQWRASEIP
ncbi:MAG: DUF3108 domain-containing protein [Burkholderiaceae bacterium]